MIEVHEVGPERAAEVLAVVKAGFGAREVLDPPSTATQETTYSVSSALAEHGGLLATSELGPVGALLLEPAASSYPLVHLFDEPQFNTQDGYIGFMLDFFRRLRGEGRLVFVCLHPTAAFQLQILREICGYFLFVNAGRCDAHADFEALVAHADVRRYLGALAP